MGYSQESNNQAVKEKLFTRDYILLIVTNGLLFFGFQFYPSGLPPFLKTLGADDIVLGFLTSLIAIPAILSRLIAGNLLDRYGRFKVLCLGLFSMTVLAYFLGVFQTVFMIFRFFTRIRNLLKNALGLNCRSTSMLKPCCIYCN